MAVTMNLKKQIDTPVWEWTRFIPVQTATVSCMASGDLPADSRYIYYINVSALYRYDTWTDSWCQLASPNTAPATMVAMRYSSYGGFRGRVLGVTGSTTMMVPGLRGSVLSGQTIRIYNGTGANQIRTITSVNDAVVFDSGIATSTSNASQIQDTTKKWKWNQWQGYQVRVIYGSGVTQVRKVLYNDQSVLYFTDANYQQIDSWNNTGFSAVAPYAIPSSSAGSQSQYVIEASTITVNSGWTVSPDTTSRFTTTSGGLWLLSTTGSAPFYTMQYYDVLSDTWFTKTAVQGLLLAAIGTDIAFERISNTGGKYMSSMATTGTTRTIVDTTLTGLTTGFTTLIDRFVNCQIRIVAGTGLGQRRRIVANNTTTFWVNRKWDTIPDTSSQYEVWDDLFAAYLGGMAASSLFNYHIEADLMCQGSVSDYGLARNMAIRLNGWDDIGISTAVRNTNGILAINTIPASGGTAHAIGDVVTLGTGTVGKVRVETILTGGAVTSVSLVGCGTGYALAGAAQSATTGSGTGLIITITSIGVVGRITTGMNHFFQIGESVNFTGANEAAWNTTSTILGVDSLTTLDVATTATLTAVATASQSVTVIVDSGANWDVSEHIGKLVCLTVAGASPTSQIRRITSNTATSLTVPTITQATNATSRYIIYDPSMIGRDEQYKYLQTQKGNTGWATSGGTVNLIDNTKNWFPAQWTSYKVRIISGTGYGNEIAITSNTPTSLAYAAPGFTPDTTTKYIIMDSFGLCTTLGNATTLYDSAKNWTANQWAGKRVKITSGTGAGNEALISGNTATQLFAASGMGSPDTTSTYTILGIPARGAGIQLMHLYGTSNLDTKGKYIWFPRGGALTTFDRLDIQREVWEYGYFFSPQTETWTTGSMYAYDGGDIIYLQKDNTGRVYSYDLRYNLISNSSTIPYGQGAALIGNRMELITTADNIDYLYMMRHTGTEMFRCLIFWQ